MPQTIRVRPEPCAGHPASLDSALTEHQNRPPHKDTTLAPAYTPFGTVIGGLNVLQKIAAASDDQQNGPGDGYPNLYTAFLFVQVIPQP